MYYAAMVIFEGEDDVELSHEDMCDLADWVNGVMDNAPYEKDLGFLTGKVKPGHLSVAVGEHE